MDIFLARQPIFDTADRLAGYELLYRSSGSRSAAGGSTAIMSLDVVVLSILELGLERVAGTVPAYLNVDRITLLSGVLDVLDPSRVIFEILETVEPDDTVLHACRQLARRGFRLALDDFVHTPRVEPLLRLASIVKLDVLDRPAHELAAAVAPLREHGVTLLAERVETAAVRDLCRDLGFTLFQGYFFSRPETLSRSALSPEQLAILQLLNLLGAEQPQEKQIEETLRADPVLTYKLLRMVNAAALGGRGITSIPHAVRVLGYRAIRRWLALLLVSSLGAGEGASLELVQLAVGRARLCELMGGAAAQAPPAEELFLLGLFSLLDALLGLPMEEVVTRVDLEPALRAALLQRTGPLLPWLRLAEAYERAEWAAVEAGGAALGVPATVLPELYLQSLAWAGEQVRLVRGG